MNNSKFYDPKEARCIVAGLDLTGYADGDKIKVEPVTKEDYKSHVGVDGDSSFSKVHDDRHTVTVTLKAGSPSNVVLEGLRRLPSSFPVAIMNTSEGKYIGGGANSRIIEKPSKTFGAEDGKVEWKILVADYSGSHMPD